MDILSDISSVSSHGSMPPLVDRFGNVVFDEDDSTTLTAGTDEPLNKHWYFDEDGNEINYEQFTGSQEETPEVWIKTPRINQKFLLKHPRVILAFLRFIDFYNELADPEEVFMLKAIPQHIIKIIRAHPGVANNPAPEFQDDINELIYRLERHADLSELEWGGDVVNVS